MAVPSRIARRLRRSRRAAALYARAQRRSEKVWAWALDLQGWLETQLFHSGMRRASGFSRLCFEQLEPRALLTVNWTGLGGNVDWSTAANWDTGVVPTTGDTVMIGSGFAGGTVDDISGLSIQSLSSGSALSITGSLAVTSTVEVDNTFTLSGTLSGADVLAGSSGQGLTITGGTLDGVTLDANASLSGATANVQNGLTINGTLNLDAAGNSELDFLGSQTLGGTGAVLFTGSINGAFSDKLEVEDNGSPATLTIGSGIEIHGGSLGGAFVEPSASGGIGAAIINNGRIIADASDQTLSVDLGTDGSSSGTLEATGGGTLAVTGGNWVDSGTNESDSGSTLEFNGVLSNSGNTLNLTGNGQFTSAAEINAGALSVAAGATLNFLNGGVLNDLTLDGNAALSGATVNVQNGLTLNGILNLNADGDSVLDFIDSQTLGGAGAVLFTGSINGAFSDKLEIEDNGSPATLTIGSGIEIHGGSVGGAFVAPSASGGGGIGAAIINNGQIIADASGRTLSVDLGSDGSSSGTLEATGGGTLSVTGGNWVDSGTNESDSGSTLAFDGVLSNSGNTLNLTGNGQFTSAAEINAGTLSVAAGATLDFLSGGVLNDLTLNGNAALSGATVNVQNGLTLNGILNLDADGDSDLVFIDSQSLGGTGAVIFTGAVNGAFSDNVEVEDNGSPATLTIGSGIEIHGGSIGGASVELDNGDASIINQGQIIADASGRTLTVELGASGTNSGTLGATGGGTLDVSSLSSNSGTISAAVGSTVAITGPLLEDPLGILSVDIGGTAAGQFGQITATGAATLDGTLDLNQANNYTPAAGDSIQIMTFAGHTGNFATVNSTKVAGQPLFAATTNPNDVTVTAAAAPAPDLSVTKVDNVGGSSITAAHGNIAPGNAITYTIVVTNAGPGAVTGASVTDPFPGTLAGISYTAVQTGGASGFTASGSGNINDAAVSMPVGSTITYTVHATVNPTVTGTLTNTATVTDPAGTTDPTPSNNTATDIDNLTPTADLSITKVDNVGGSSITATYGSVVPGVALTYTIVVSNSGPSSAVGARVADTMPAGIASDTWTASATGGASGFSANGLGSINDTAVNMPSGSTVTYTVVAIVSSSAIGTLSNTATVTAPPGVTDSNFANNTATDSDNLVPVGTPTLSIGNSAIVRPASGTVDEVFTVTLSSASASSVTVNYATADGTAHAGTDYTATSGPLTFPAGTTTENITVSVLGGAQAASSETFAINLSSPLGATIGTGTATGKIDAAAVWTGDGDGINWSDPDNWQDNLKPTTGDVVQIGSGFAGPITDDVNGLSIQSLTAGSDVTLAGNLTVTGAATFNDNFSDNGHLIVEGGLTLNGTLTMGDSGGSVTFQGTQSLIGTGQVLLGASGEMDAVGDGGANPARLTIGPNIAIHGSGFDSLDTGFVGDSIVNQGHIIADTGGEITVFFGTDGSNTGTLEATSGGSLALRGNNWISTGVNLADSGGTLAFDSGTIANAGHILALTGTGTFSLRNTIQGGTITVPTGNSVELGADGSTSLVGVTLDGNATLVGSPDAGAGLTVAGGLTLNGVLSIGSPDEADFQGAQSILGAGSIQFTGSGATLQVVEDNGTNPPRLTIGPHIVIQSGGTNALESVLSGGSIVNQGQIVSDAAGGTFSVDFGFGGSNPGNLAATNGGTLSISNLGSNSGTISAGVASTVAITGALVQDSSGILSVDIGGAAPGQFGQITATGAATLDGTLDLNQANGYTPGVGDSIQIMTFTGHTGNFATVNSTQVAGQPLFFATTNPDDVTVTAAAAPAPELSVAIADSAGGSSITAAQGNVLPGQTLIYTVTVSNAGSGDADEVSVSDLLPDLLLGGTYAAMLNGDASDSNPTGSGGIDDTVDLPAGSSIVYTVTGTVSPGASGILVNVATVTPGDPLGSSAARPAAVMPLMATDMDNVVSPPVANPDTATTSVNTPVMVSVLANDADSNSTLVPGSVTITSAPLNGLAVVNPDGTITYTPNAGFTGADQLTYTVQDALGLTSNPATLDLRVGPAVTQTGVSVTGNGQSIDNGSTTPSIANGTDFGGISLGDSSLSEPYTIHNTGTTALNLSTLSIGGADPVDFTILNPPAGMLPAGSSTTFNVRFEPTATGNRMATILFTPEDSTTPFTFDIQGTATAAGTPTKLAAQISDDVGGSSVAATDGHVAAGQTLEYFITFINPGPDNVTSATVTDLFPAGLSNIHWTASATPGVTGFSTSGSGNIGDTAVNLKAFTSLTYVVTATVGPNFSGQLTNTATITGGGTSASATDVDNGTSSVLPALPTISIDSITVVKPINGPSTATFTVTLSSPSNVPVSVHYATQDGTAIAGIDYQATSNTLTFPKGITSETFSVPILDGLSQPATLTFDVVLSNPVGATAPIATGVGTIFAFAQFIPTSPVVSPETPFIPTATGAVVSLPTQGSTDVAAARLAANNLLFAYYGSDGSLRLKDSQPWLNHDLAPDLSALGDGPSMPEERGQEIVLALALTTVPEAEGAALSDERPDPQKLPHLAALDLALPMPTAPIEQAVADTPRSWWLVGSSAVVLAVSSAVLLAPRWRGKRRRLAGKVAPASPETTDGIGGP